MFRLLLTWIWPFVACLFLFILTSAVALAEPLHPAPPPDFSRLKPESIKKWSGAEVLLIGKFIEVMDSRVTALTDPPIFFFRVQIATKQNLRGPDKLDQKLTANFSISQENKPSFPNPDQDCVIVLKSLHNRWIMHSYEEATAQNFEQAKLAVSFPLG